MRDRIAISGIVACRRKPGSRPQEKSSNCRIVTRDLARIFPPCRDRIGHAIVQTEQAIFRRGECGQTPKGLRPAVDFARCIRAALIQSFPGLKNKQ